MYSKAHVPWSEGKPFAFKVTVYVICYIALLTETLKGSK